MSLNITKSKYLLIAALILFISFLTDTNVYADAVLSPFDTNEKWLVLVPIIVCIIALIAWFIIRSVRKKKDADNT